MNRSSVNARTWVAQPIGDNQESQSRPVVESPIARSANVTPSAAPARPLAVREYSAIWAVTPATPVNTSPTDAMPSPNASDPDAAIPAATMAPLAASPVARLSPAPTSSAAVSGAYRPTTVEDSSSCLPVSSSCRVCRVTTNTQASARNSGSSVP